MWPNFQFWSSKIFWQKMLKFSERISKFVRQILWLLLNSKIPIDNHVWTSTIIMKFEAKMLKDVRDDTVYNFFWSIVEELTFQLMKNWHGRTWLSGHVEEWGKQYLIKGSLILLFELTCQLLAHVGHSWSFFGIWEGFIRFYFQLPLSLYTIFSIRN